MHNNVSVVVGWTVTCFPAVFNSIVNCFRGKKKTNACIKVKLHWFGLSFLHHCNACLVLSCRKSFLVAHTMWFTSGMLQARLASEEQSITRLDLCTLWLSLGILLLWVGFFTLPTVTV